MSCGIWCRCRNQDSGYIFLVYCIYVAIMWDIVRFLYEKDRTIFISFISNPLAEMPKPKPYILMTLWHRHHIYTSRTDNLYMCIMTQMEITIPQRFDGHGHLFHACDMLITTYLIGVCDWPLKCHGIAISIIFVSQ